MIKAPVNKIISFSNVDGPGNRTSIFFQSCPFHCLYCHNPETINYCIHCGKCVKTCPVEALSMINGKVVWDKDKCVSCDTCIKTCPNLSSPKITYMSVDEVLQHIIKSKPFIKGITVSGGECTNQHQFLVELFKEVHKLGLTTFMDSNGCRLYSEMADLMEVTDKVMLDVKAYDNDFHKLITGSDNDIVLENLNYLLENDKIYEVRTVLLNNHQQNIKTVENVSRIIKDKCIYKLIKYRPFGVREEGLQFCGRAIVSDQQINEMKELALANGATNVRIV
ncbi:MAG: YjjW family glycine radical enzyme activase [Erysipelotrichaceae bacterium]|nr:YjjW family glycine radical enzyme activase [Erysipelotrichaceae bacterium]